MVTSTLEDYEALALKLATEPALLKEITEKLEKNRSITPLFDTDWSCRHIEAAYKTMWEIHERGEAPSPYYAARV